MARSSGNSLRCAGDEASALGIGLRAFLPIKDKAVARCSEMGETSNGAKFLTESAPYPGAPRECFDANAASYP